MRYTLTWSEEATYKTEITVTNAELAAWANRSGILRSSRHLKDPHHIVTAEEMTAMQAANPAFHRVIVTIYTNRTRVLRTSDSATVAARGQHIISIHSSPADEG